MKPGLQLKLSQHLALTPQLQQSIKLLQLSTLELDQEIERILLENPLLEREEPVEYEAITTTDTLSPPSSLPDISNPQAEHESNLSEEPPPVQDALSEHESLDRDTWDSTLSSNYNPDDEESDMQDLQASMPSLHEHLNQQIALSPLSDRDRALVRFLIEALDDSGYLRQSLEELLSLIPADHSVELEDLTIALRYLHTLEPAGVGAGSLQECLALQLRSLPESPERDLALNIVTSHLELLAERNFVKLKKIAECSDEQLRTAHTLICSLDPHPGNRYGTTETRYIIPDVIVKKVRKQWTVQLNQDAMPRLRVNELYASILQQHRGESGSLSTQLQEARWLIKNVQQRFETILRVSQTIVEQQRQFFEHGEVAMRPLTLKEIAEQLELHESTISRVTTQKFMATPRGIFELKYFFGSHVATDTGGAASSTAIRALLRQLIDAEDRKKPLSDAKIADLLGQQGIVIARRTVAKYRESLNIPPVSLRKTI